MPPTDPNESALGTWIETTDGFDRVEAVLEQTRDPTAAATIADRAHVSESTARKHLTRLADLGVARTTEDGRTTLYARNDDHYLLERVQALQRTHSSAELLEGIAEMKADLREYRERYGAESPEAVAASVDVDGDDASDPWGDLADWRATRTNLAIAQTALSFKRARDLANA